MQNIVKIEYPKHKTLSKGKKPNLGAVDQIKFNEIVNSFLAKRKSSKQKKRTFAVSGDGRCDS